MRRYREDPFPWWFKIVLVLTRLAAWTYVIATVMMLATCSFEV